MLGIMGEVRPEYNFKYQNLKQFLWNFSFFLQKPHQQNALVLNVITQVQHSGHYCQMLGHALRVTVSRIKKQVLALVFFGNSTWHKQKPVCIWIQVFQKVGSKWSVLYSFYNQMKFILSSWSVVCKKHVCCAVHQGKKDYPSAYAHITD